MTWLHITCILVCCLKLVHSKASEYQLDSESLSRCELLRGVAVAKQQGDGPHCTEDGQFRPVQCIVGGQECWCVDTEGQEVAGTRTNNSVPHCLRPCHLQRQAVFGGLGAGLPQCQPSGDFESVQCDASRGRCWCVDQDGMELYGTRQTGRPERCPGSCEVRARRLLHDSRGRSPPQCSDDGGFLPVQCKFINTTDRTELDLLHTFTRFPEAFETFSNFRRFFPLVSSYCFCSDSRGREMDHTGVELLLSQVYDSAFSGEPAGPGSFSQSNIYRVLQRRMLGVRLALTGHFRCPSPCEEERRFYQDVSCEAGGSFSSRQCQGSGGQCWCVDPTGRELPGTRQHGDTLVCSSGFADCPSQRRLALSRLFSGPVAPPSSSSSSSSSSSRPSASCQSLLRAVRAVLPVEQEASSFLSRLAEVLQGLFSSVGVALRALTHSSPRRLQENLFGGKFLKNAVSLNFSGVLGPRGALGLDRFSSSDQNISASLRQNQDLVQSVSRVLEDPDFISTLQHTLMRTSNTHSTSLTQVLTPLLRSCSNEEEEEGQATIFVPSCMASGGFQEVQCQGAECWCVDPQGQEVLGSRTTGQRPRCSSRCERERAMALKVKGNMAAGAELHVPACSEDGSFLPLQCVGSRCVCVDVEGNPTTAGGAVTCSCSQAFAVVTAFRQEVDRIVSLSNSSHLPLGYGFLLAEGLRLTPEELQISQSAEEHQILNRLLSRSKAALRLAAYSTLRRFWRVQRLSYQPYTPQCDINGHWIHTQCHYSTGQCWCVDEDGEYIPDSLTSRSLRMPTCPTRCQRAHAHMLLSGWMKGSDITITSSYSPKCDKDGGFSVLQTGGAAAWCVNSRTGESLQTAALTPAGQLTCPSWCELQGLQCEADGSFAPLQCDITSCWCVSEDGQEASGTRTPRQTGSVPSCDRPLCPGPTVTHGALLCRPVTGGRQRCDLVCHRAYQNALPGSSFLCEAETRQWAGDKPLAGACQMSVCDESSVQFECDSDDVMRLKITWTASLSNLPTSDLPDLHDIDVFLNESRLLAGVQGLLDNFQTIAGSESKLVSTTTPSFGCSNGYHLDTEGKGCVVCPAGSFSRVGACLLCRKGTYQDEEGRDFCNKCPRGSSAIGASSVNQCVTECQRRGLQCSDRGDFLSAQHDFLSGRWRCVSSEGVELEWTSSNEPLTNEACTVLRRFQAVPGSALFVGAEDTEVLVAMTSDLRTCVQACAVDSSCHHVALFTENGQTQCQLYSTHTLNTHCNTSQQSSGFLGNPQAELFDWLRCSLKVRGGASDLLVVRKKGTEFSTRLQKSFVRMRMMKAVSGVYRTLVFSSRGTSLTDAHRFCQDGCSRDACCDGFILNQNVLNGGSLLCGWLRAPSVLLCGDKDWDVIGQGKANRICGAGLKYNKQQRSFIFNFGGQEFTILDSSLPSDSQNKTDYQASIISFQSIYLNTASVQRRFESLLEDDVLVDPQTNVPALTYWLNKNNYNSQQALLWCLTRCDAEQQFCSVVDLRDADSAGFFSCVLHPDSRVCAAYDRALRRPCRPLLARTPNTTFIRTVDLSGPVKNFYNRVSFQKMVSYSVRSRVNLGNTNHNLSEGFMQCERRCDEDPCCRGFGFVRDKKSPGGMDLVCLALISLGVQTCGEDDGTTWRSQDCRPSAVQTNPPPLGWYQKPVNQWTSFPALCPPFSLPPSNVSLDQWSLLADSAVLVEPSVSSYDVIHVSQDIATDWDKTRDWCLHACQEAESCVALSISQTESAVRCVLYPDTRTCGLSSAPRSSSSTCRLVIREPASQVYLRKERLPLVTSVSIPGHGTLQGVAIETTLGSDRKMVVQFLGVPYARPPIGSLRFRAAQPSDWTGTWDATKPRPSCIQPGDVESAASSEDCLYLNIFSPAGLIGRVPVLVFFFNPSANQSPGVLDGSTLAAMGNIVVVTASYRTDALGFLSTGSSGLHGNYGLSDQEAVLRWVNTHISLLGGDNRRLTVGAERHGADITSLHLLSPSSSSPLLFQRMMLMGGSVFSPAAVQSLSSSKRQAIRLARELGCLISDLTDDPDDGNMTACLRTTPAHAINAAQTKLLAVSGPFQTWSPVIGPLGSRSFHSVDLLMGTSMQDGLISRARRIKDFEALQGRADGKTAFYEALSNSLGGARSSSLVKEAATWFYSLQHSPSPAGYNLFSRTLDNATRDLFIVCPSQQMAQHWAGSKANVFLYHLPDSSTHNRADVSVPLDVQFVFGIPHHPINSQRFTWTERRLSLAMMTYVSNFIKTGNPNRVPGSALPRWRPVLPFPGPARYLKVEPNLRQGRGLRQEACSFWNRLAPKLTGPDDELGAELVQPALTPDLPIVKPLSQSQTEKEAYS
ncbi:thyroglobulin [Diretmus argenteus]